VGRGSIWGRSANPLRVWTLECPSPKWRQSLGFGTVWYTPLGEPAGAGTYVAFL
jgi:hypothetical protein